MADPVYKEPGNEPSEPAPRRPDWYKKDPGSHRQDLAKAESSPEKQASESTQETTSAEDLTRHENQIGQGFRRAGKDKPGRGRFSLRRRRNVVIGGAALGVGGGIAALLIFFSGPLQFIHFAQLLQRFHLSNNENFGDGRASRTIMYAALGQPNKSRLGFITNKYADKWEARMVRETGLRPLYTKAKFGIFQRFAGFEVVDRNKARPYLAEFEKDDINTRASPSGTVDSKGKSPPSSAQIADFRNKRDGYNRSAVRTVSKGTSSSKVASFGSARLLNKRGGIDFHPLRSPVRAVGATLATYKASIKKSRADRVKNGVDVVPANVQANQTEDSEGNPQTDPADKEAERQGNDTIEQAKQAGDAGPEGSATLKSLGTALRTASGPAIIIGTLCAVKSFGENVEEYQYTSTLLPMMRMGGLIITTGNQVMSGQNVSLDELGAIAEDFYDEETKTSWNQARSIQAELGQPQTGPDIPPEAKVDKDKPKIFQILDNIKGLGATCGVAGKLASIPIVKQVGEWTSATFIAGIDAVIGPLGYSVEDVMTGALKVAAGRGVDPYAKGAELGNLANYGARLMANDQALAMGGRSLNDAELAVLDSQAAESDKYNFSKRAIAQRIFDPYDRRSAVAGLLDNMPGSFAQFRSSLMNLPKILTGSFASIVNLGGGTAQAAQNYNYGFPEFGFSADEQADPRFENPYENEAFVEPRLNELNEKYGNCFSTKVVPNGGGVSLETGGSVNYKDLEKENCRGVLDGKHQTEELLRYRFYLADVITAHSLACYEGDEDSCSQLGFGGSYSTDSSTTTSAAGTSFDTGALTEDSSSIACADGTRNLGIHTGYSGGQPVKIRLCALPNLPCPHSAECNNGYGIKDARSQAVVNSRVSGALYAMVQAARADGVSLSAGSSFRTIEHQQNLCPCDGVRVARPGYSNHQMGLAIDFGGLPSSAGPLPGNPIWEWLSKNAGAYGYKNYQAEAWHWSPTGH
ncbi:MAG: M15 family metallopeptidase [Candidatus Saccharimonadales bacterium]